MMSALIPLLILLAATGAASALFSILFWRNRAVVTGAIQLTVILSALTLWAWSMAARIGGAGLIIQYGSAAIETYALGIIPAALLLLSLHLSGRMNRATHLRDWFSFLVIPVTIGTVLLLTTILPNSLPMEAYSLTDPFFLFFTSYNAVVTLTALAIIVQCYRSPVGLFRGQLSCLLIAVLMPAVLHVLFLLRVTPFGSVDLAPVGGIVTVAAFAIGTDRYSLFKILPINHTAVVRQLPEGIIILDTAGRIIEINTSARRSLGIEGRDVTGEPVSRFKPLDEIPPDGADISAGGRHPVIQRVIGGETRQIEVRRIPLQTREGERKGTVLLLTDVTDQVLTEQSLNNARHRINVLTSITRHDILNQLTVIILHNEILQDSVMDPGLARSLSEQDKAAKKIRRQIAFTRDYEKLGENLPVWTDIRRIFTRHTDAHGYDYIHYSTHVEGLEVFADPLIDQVFDNLIDNSLRYGQKVTSIRLYTVQNLGGLKLVYEDNGVGIPAGDKEKIFQRGAGRDMGFGLFFSREILNITDITIHETGQEGSGTRFEMLIPWGRFRFRRDRAPGSKDQSG